jgi:hypothetical protein
LSFSELEEYGLPPGTGETGRRKRIYIIETGLRRYHE